MSGDDHFERIARYGFVCQGGQLEWCLDYQALIRDYKTLDAEVDRLRAHVATLETMLDAVTADRDEWRRAARVPGEAPDRPCVRQEARGEAGDAPGAVSFEAAPDSQDAARGESDAKAPDWREGRDPLDVLDVDLGEALTGEHVHAWTGIPHPGYPGETSGWLCARCGYEHENWPPARVEYAYTWDGLGRVVEAMAARGWGFSLHLDSGDDSRPGASFLRQEVSHDYLGDTAPQAVAHAALAALRSEAGEEVDHG